MCNDVFIMFIPRLRTSATPGPECLAKTEVDLRQTQQAVTMLAQCTIRTTPMLATVRCFMQDTACPFEARMLIC